MDSGFFNDFESKDINMLEANDSIVQEDERSEIRPDTTPGSTRKKRKAKARGRKEQLLRLFPSPLLRI